MICGVRSEGEQELGHEVLESIRNWGVNDITKGWAGFVSEMTEQLLLLQKEQDAAAAAAAGSSEHAGNVAVKQEPGSSSSSAAEQQLEELVRQHLVCCKAVAALNPGE
jgi:hypothetical protein